MISLFFKIAEFLFSFQKSFCYYVALNYMTSVNCFRIDRNKS